MVYKSYVKCQYFDATQCLNSLGNYKLHLVNNVVSISTVCYLRVYCQTVNTVARGNLHYQLGMAEKKIKP